jgi:hypothetical protein
MNSGSLQWDLQSTESNVVEKSIGRSTLNQDFLCHDGRWETPEKVKHPRNIVDKMTLGHVVEFSSHFNLRFKRYNGNKAEENQLTGVLD